MTIKNQIFGVANASNQTGIGIMGMAPSANGWNNEGMYPLILTTMAKSGAIKSPAFSLDLRNTDNATGTLLFGGVDKSKFSGSLVQVPFETVTQTYKGQKFNDTL